jgi:HTH-type transcriptional regulator/antitoxin MqsA
MKCEVCAIGNRIEKLVRYSVDLGDRLVLVENVPAIVCDNCGEVSFSPQIASRIQHTVREGKAPSRTVDTLVYDLAR